MPNFLTAHHYTNSQNSIISSGYNDFEAKIFPILYPPLENSTTLIAIILKNIRDLTVTAQYSWLVLLHAAADFQKKKNCESSMGRFFWLDIFSRTF